MLLLITLLLFAPVTKCYGDACGVVVNPPVTVEQHCDVLCRVLYRRLVWG